MTINRKACGQFMHWWQKTDHNRHYYAYIDWNGNLLFRDVYHEKTVAGVYEVDGKCKFVISGNEMLFDRVEIAHLKWLVSIIWEMLEPSWISTLVLLALTPVAVGSIYYWG